MKNISVPRKFWSLLWPVSPPKLDVQKDRTYTVYQLLHYGDLDAFSWLKRTHTLPMVRKVA